MENKNNISFLKKLKISIKDIDQYDQISELKFGSMFKYLLLIILFSSIIISICFVSQFSISKNKLSSYLKDNLPDFSIKDNNLSTDIENPVEFNNKKYFKIKFIIDNSENIEKYEEKYKNTSDYFIIIAMKNKIYFKSLPDDLYSNESFNSIEYKDLTEKYGWNFSNKTELINYINNNYNYIEVVLVSFISMYFVIFIVTIFNVIALILFALISKFILRLNIKLKNLINISISAITFPTILSVIYYCVIIIAGYTMPHFQTMYTLISYVYIIFSLLIIRQNYIKNKQLVGKAVGKVEEKEDKLKKETEDKEKEEKKTNDKEKKDNNEKEKLKDKDGKKDSKDETPSPQENIQGEIK